MPKKRQKTQAQEPSTTIGEESQTLEVARSDVEVVPATIVEAGEVEVFSAQTDLDTVEGSQAEVVTEEQQIHSVEQTTQPVQPATEKKPRVDKRPFIPWLTEQLETPQDRKLLLKTILEKWPTVSKGGVQTFLTDMLNPRYSFFKNRPVVKLADGRVVFADKVPVESVQEERTIDGTPAETAPAEETSPQAEKESELPAE